jgi:predicted DNA-binding helix-hairpin-helix protein
MAFHTFHPVCERRVNLLVCSLPLHRHSYIGFILAFASSIHNKQQTVPFQKAHDLDQVGWLMKLLTFFTQHIRLKHNRWLKAEVIIVETLT